MSKLSLPRCGMQIITSDTLATQREAYRREEVGRERKDKDKRKARGGRRE